MAAGIPEVPNFIKILHESPLKDNHLVHWLTQNEYFVFTLIASGAVSLAFIIGARNLTKFPGKVQNVLELLIDGLYNLVTGILGKHNGEKYLPYLGTLFIFILSNNLLGMIPMFKASTSAYTTTVTLAVMTFLYVQYIALTHMGPLKYLYHLAGSPKDTVTWIMSPLMFVLHVVGELARPVSLSLRLFGNIFGEEIIVGVFAGFGILGMKMILGEYTYLGLPVQLPFIFLSLLTCTLQALVFTILSTIYISLALDDGH